jgi:uncharacterized protein (DUF4415 family)
MKQKKIIDPDKPLTRAEFKSMKWVHGLDGLASIIGEEAVTPLRLRGRPPIENPKKRITLRLDDKIISALHTMGKGYNARVEKLLLAAIEQGKL